MIDASGPGVTSTNGTAYTSVMDGHRTLANVGLAQVCALLCNNLTPVHCPGGIAIRRTGRPPPPGKHWIYNWVYGNVVTDERMMM